MTVPIIAVIKAVLIPSLAPKSFVTTKIIIVEIISPNMKVITVKSATDVMEKRLNNKLNINPFGIMTNFVKPS